MNDISHSPRPSVGCIFARRGWALLLLWLPLLFGAVPVHAVQAGIDWTSPTSAGGGNAWVSVTYGNGLFVAVAISGTGNRVMTSPDGITWTARTSAADNSWQSVTYGNGLFVAVATTGTGNRVMTSPDGITWTARTSAADNSWRSVTYGNGLFVAVASSGTGNRVMTSPDGITWTARTSAADILWRSVTYGNGLFVAVAFTGTGNRVMTSPDGITWTARTSAADILWQSVTYGNGLFVAVATTGTGNRVMTSSNGITWTARTSAADNQWQSVTYGNGLFVAVATTGTGNRVMTSSNGITWTARTSAADNQWQSVTYGNGLFVAVASTLSASTQVMTSGNVCGEGLPLTTGAGALWSPLALPCVPNTATVQGALGSGAAGNLLAANYDSANYANSQNWWRLYAYNASTPGYELPPIGEAVSVGTGYWLKSFDAPQGGGNLTVTGTATPAPVTTVEGCAVAAGCKAVALTVAANRYNLVGNPFAYNVDWAQVRIRVGGVGGAVYTPSQAAGLDASGNASPPVLANQIWIWNGNVYQTWDDVTSIGNLQYFQSFWVKVLPGAVGQTVELLIPAEASTHARLDAGPAQALAAAPLPWYLGWLDWVSTPAQAADSEWQVRLGVENRVTGWNDTTNLLGQKLTAQTGYDRHDLIGMAPFATPYLSLVLPHTDWPATADGQKRAGDYDTDFRPAQGNPVTTWSFELRGSPTGGKVWITWQGDPAILKRSRLVDLQTGQTLDPTATAYAQGYPVVLRSGKQRYQWRYVGP